MADSTVFPDFQSSIDALSTIAKEKGGDDFRIQVLRKASPAAPLTSIATFDGANVGHFAVPQAWLVPFCGGGPVFVLWAYHASDPNKLVVQVYPPEIKGSIRDPDLLAPSRDGWNGPSTLISPLPPAVKKEAPSSGLATLFQLPTGSPSGGSAREAGSPAGGPGHSSEADRLAALRLEILDQQRRNDNDRLEKMIEAGAKAAERQLAVLTDLIKTVAQRPVAEAKPQPSIVDQAIPLVAALTPIMLKLFDRNDAAAKTSLEREARREEREAASRAEAAKIQAEFINRLSSGNSETAKVMQSMADVVANSMKAQLQTFATLRELMPGEPAEEGIIPMIKAVAPAVAEFFAARSAMAGSSPPQLPAHIGPSSVPPPGPANGTPPPASEAVDPAGVATADPAVLLAEIETAIKDHHEPKELAAGYVEALASNAGFRDFVAQSGGTYALFQLRLGSWVMDPAPDAQGVTNGNYLRTVVSALTGIAQQRGVSI